jgi:hypothetical protein
MKRSGYDWDGAIGKRVLVRRFDDLAAGKFVVHEVVVVEVSAKGVKIRMADGGTEWHEKFGLFLVEELGTCEGPSAAG